jgi:hypothetical protein
MQPYVCVPKEDPQKQLYTAPSRHDMIRTLLLFECKPAAIKAAATTRATAMVLIMVEETFVILIISYCANGNVLGVRFVNGRGKCFARSKAGSQDRKCSQDRTRQDTRTVYMPLVLYALLAVFHLPFALLALNGFL